MEENNWKLFETIEQERRGGLDVDAKCACGRSRSNNDLDPK